MNDQTPLLQMRGICKQYPGIQALNDAALEVRAGEVHVLLGENGAGKSTLMKILSGAVRRDAGDVAVAEDRKTAAEERLLRPIQTGVLLRQEFDERLRHGQASGVWHGRH